jgi:hypothetical protein
MKSFTKPQYEVADILNQYGQAYRQQQQLPLQSHKVMNAIQNCRTPFLGGHKEACNQCDHQRFSYNSCRNRHCPKCQGMEQLKWVDKRTDDLLPVRYFHTVFTIPRELNDLCLGNKKLLYDILFKASKETILTVSRNEKHLGASPGIISVLHTWGQNLMDPPHIHMIITGGGISNDGEKWIDSRKKFFLPVKVLSRVFRGKFLAMLKEQYHADQLCFLGNNVHLKDEKAFGKLLDTLYEKEWVVFTKKPFGNGAAVFRYLVSARFWNIPTQTLDYQHIVWIN